MNNYQYIDNEKDNKKDNKKDKIPYKKEFLITIFIIALINIYLLGKTNDFTTATLLLLTIIYGFFLSLIVINDLTNYLNFFHCLLFLLIILKMSIFKNIYLLFIFILLIVIFILRLIFDTCFFEPYNKKKNLLTAAEIKIFISLLFIIWRIYNENMYKNLLKFN